MLNFANLNDVEFEYLCQDIMQKKLNCSLRRFAQGRDGGVDLTDSVIKRNIVVQVKHYVNSSVDALVGALKQELDKIKKINPKQYFICCSKNLSPQKVKEIYELFVNYMASDKNIITLNEIEDYLNAPDNIDILSKHYKLWLDSTGILEQLGNNDIFVDCESLLSNIENDKKYFVRTKIFNRCLDCLAHNKTIFITGDPGVGKTITSKMLVMHYATAGYRVRYTTNSSDLKELKKALSRSPEQKEIILVDDCLGQAYFEMKETQNEELLSLIKYISLSKNKLLVLNSRVTIYQEAKDRKPELVKSLENGEFKVFIIDMNAISNIEKAKILYNHLYFNNTQPQYFNAIREEYKYRKIILHPNYNPRLIEFICNPNRYIGVNANEYYNFITRQLDNPKQIWKDEYERRLQKVDRILLSTIYSLSDKEVPITLLKTCFDKAIYDERIIDKTINQFEASLTRLLGGFISIVDKKGSKMISMANPSINDYLDGRLKENATEKNILISNAIHIWQFKRLMTNREFEDWAVSLIISHQDNNVIFENENQKKAFVANYIAKGKVCDIYFRETVHSYLLNPCHFIIARETIRSLTCVIKGLLDDKLYEFYDIKTLLMENDGLIKILSVNDLDDVIEIVRLLDKKFQDFADRNVFIEIATEQVENAISTYCDSYTDVSDFDVDIDDIVRRSFTSEEDFDEDYAADKLSEEVCELILEHVHDEIDLLPSDIEISSEFIDNLTIGTCGVSEAISDYMSEARYDEMLEYKDYLGGESEWNEIDFIFKRK